MSPLPPVRAFVTSMLISRNENHMRAQVPLRVMLVVILTGTTIPSTGNDVSLPAHALAEYSQTFAHKAIPPGAG